MRRIRFLLLGFVTFVAAIFGALLVPGTWVNRVFSTLFCGIFSFNSMVCTANWGQSSQRVVAATSPAVENTIFDGFGDLLAQRDPSEFGDDQPSAPSPQQSNPQAPPFPQDPGPNFPVRPDFDDADTNSSRQRSFVTLEPGRRYQLNGTSPDKNSRYTAEVMVENGQAFIKSIVLTDKSSSNLPDEIYNIGIAPSGTEMSIRSNNRGTLTIKRVQNSWISQFTNPSGISTNWEIPVKQKFNKNFIKMINKRLCQDQVEELISRNIPNLLDFINKIADKFKKLFAVGLELDNNLKDKPEQKEKLFEKFEEKIDELKDFNDKLKESIECEPSEKPNQQNKPNNNQIIWTLEFDSIWERDDSRVNSSCYIKKVTDIRVIQTGNSLNATLGWIEETTGGGTTKYPVSLTGTIENSNVRMQVRGSSFEGVVNRTGQQAFGTVKATGTTRPCNITGRFLMIKQN